VSSSEILRGPTLQIGGAESGPFFGVSFGPAQPARGLTHIGVFGGSFTYNGYFGTPRLGPRAQFEARKRHQLWAPKCMQLWKFPLH